MKNFKSLFAFLFCFFTIAGLHAQITFGVKGGANMSISYGSPEKIDGDQIEGAGLLPGYQFGATIGLGITESFKLLGEVNFESKSGLKKIDVTSIVPTAAGDVIVVTDADLTNTLNFVNIPVLAVFGSGPLKFYGGLNFAYLVSAKSKRTTITDVTLPEGLPANSLGLPQSGTVESEIDFKNDEPYDKDGSYINEVELGGNIGVMYMMSENLYFDLRANHGITDLTNNDYDVSLIDGSKRDDKDRSFSLQLSVGYNF